jgi:PKD repeat protein
MLIRFAIFQSEGGPVPNGATITSATLSIYTPYGPDVVTKASRLLKSWSEMQVTWNAAAAGAPWTTPGALSAGNDYVATADGQGSVGDANANGCSTTWGADACWLNINVTPGVQAFAGGTPNFGWKLAQVSSSGQFVYKDLISRENANFPTLRPKLTIAWTSAGVPAAQLTANPTSGQPPLNVTFDASGSTDNGAPITGLHLAFGDGTPDVTWSNKNQTQLHTYNTAETYTATLTATNANGTSAPVTRVITVSTTPIGPTAQFTATPSSGTEPLSVIFSASGSTQGTAQISSLRLQFGYNAQEITWSDKNAPQSFTYPAGDFIATLTVTDSSNLTSSTTRAIHVNPVGIGEVAPGTDPAGSLGFSVPTFHSMSLYYSPASAPSNCTTSVGSGCKVWMRYRKATEPNTAWHEGYPLWFDPRTTDGNSPATNTLPFTATHPETLQVLQYRARGSAVLLQPGTKYFFEFGIGTAFNTATWLHYVAGTTWSETFAQDGDVVTIPNTSGTCPAAGPCVITQGGSATSGYKIYDGWNGTSKNVIDRLGQNTESDIGVDNSHAIVVKADFVIVRRVRARGAATAAIYVAPDVTDVVIEDCDVDDWAWRADGTNGWGTWGRNEAAGIHLGGNNSRIVVQRNVIKAPHLGAFPWDTDRSAIEVPNNHPAGTNGISVWSGGQQNVIRYNEITGDPTNKHKSYQDGIGGAENFSTKGSPGADSDIYQNIIMNVFDDAIEAEGGGRNVRVWGNYINEAKTAVATTTVHFGPTYVWRNVVNHMRVRYYSTNDTDADFPMTAFKFGGWNDVRAGEGYGEGIRYLFHNTLLQEPLGAFPEGAGLGVEDTSNGRQSVSWTIAKNNIFHIRDSNYYSVESGNTPTGSSFSYNVYNGRYTDPDVLSESTPAATYKFSNAGATPELFYKPGHGYSSVPALGGNGTGNYQLEAGSKGLDVGDLIPNFNDGYTGAAPDVGAHENGAPPMRFGITAGQ